MDMMSELAALGTDIEDALKRFMGNSALYMRMLKKLPDNIERLGIREYIISGDLDTALSNAHTLKGVYGNMSVTPLYKAYTEIVALLRENKPTEALAALEKVLSVQERLVEIIKSENND